MAHSSTLRHVSGSASHRTRSFGRHVVWHLMTAGMFASLVWTGATRSAHAATQGAPKTTLDGVFTDAQSERGAGIAALSCEVCHGVKFAGADMGPGLAAADFKMNWVGRPLSELFEKINTTMPQNDPGTL